LTPAELGLLLAGGGGGVGGAAAAAAVTGGKAASSAAAAPAAPALGLQNLPVRSSICPRCTGRTPAQQGVGTAASLLIN
jgi:hypothetical protein